VTVEFLWGERAGPTRGPKPSMTLDRIADVAIAIADADGLAATSMQRVATDLGVTKMALYRYLPGRAELLASMVERALGPAPEPAAGGWRAALTEWTERLLDGYLRHPWILAATVGARPIGPHELDWMERGLTVLTGTPLTAAERLDTLAVLTGQARMFAEQHTAARQPEALLAAAIDRAITRHGDRFPALAATMAEAGPDGQDQAFRYGLDRVLDGVEALINRRSGRSPGQA
jgi:AcrR family transcriptional regulator